MMELDQGKATGSPTAEKVTPAPSSEGERRMLKMTPPPEFKIGDQVAINLGYESDPHQGEIVAVLDLPGWMFLNYVVALETEMDPLLEVRSGYAIHPWELTEAANTTVR